MVGSLTLYGGKLTQILTNDYPERTGPSRDILTLYGHHVMGKWTNETKV